MPLKSLEYLAKCNGSSRLEKVFCSKVSNETSIPESYFLKRPLVGTKDKVFESLDRYEELGCEYLIAYVADITWANSLEILKERL